MNVLIIMTDQQRADSLGCTGNHLVKTPAIDALALRGANFRNHLTPHQICSPSRSTFFSGLYSRHHGLARNGMALPESVSLISHELKTAGYRTHGVGKFHFQPILAEAEHCMPDSNAFWNLPESENWKGPFYGFDTTDILIGESVGSTVGGHYAQWLHAQAPGAADLYAPERALSAVPSDLDEVWKCAVPQNLHYNTWITSRACDFIEHSDRDEEPFLLFVSFPDPHHPFSPPAPWCDLYEPSAMPDPRVRAGELDLMPDYIASTSGEEGGKSYVEFLQKPGLAREQGFMQTTEHVSSQTLKQAIAHTYGSISMIDHGVGKILAMLGDKGLTENTLVVFTSDHGELLGDHGLIRKGPAPYRELLHVPFIVAGPKVTVGDRHQMTSHLDVKATISEHLGLGGSPTDGCSFASALHSRESVSREKLFTEYHPRTQPETYNQSVITPHWRLTVYPNKHDWGELFDLRNDPGEHRNLFHDANYLYTRNDLLRDIEDNFPAAPEAGVPPIATY